MPNRTYFESLKEYVGFTDASSAVLREAAPLVEPSFRPIIDDFYATIEAHSGARAAITGGVEQIDRLKTTLRQWLGQVFTGPHDEGYYERRARIGRVHVRISLPQAYMLTAMDRIRVRTVDVLREALADDLLRLSRVVTALHQILDLDLAIMLETYREDLEAKNRTAERLATIGQFAAGIGHELRNPLGVVESSVFLLRQHLDRNQVKDPAVLKHLDKISSEVQRSNKTITDLLELARSRPPRRHVITARSALAQAAQSASLPPTVDIRIDAPDDVTIDADASQMGNVLVNLLINASQAMNAKGRITLSAERDGNRTRLRVVDDGPGVPAELRGRIFEALFTTKAKGTGLGLALCRRIVEAHGGTIVVEPTATGASFLVTIPDRSSEPIG